MVYKDMKPFMLLDKLSDRDLLEAATHLARNERRATTELIAALAEVDARRLYLGEGCSSLFTYCVQVLRLSAHAAYERIEAARVARKYPVVLDALAQGRRAHNQHEARETFGSGGHLFVRERSVRYGSAEALTPPLTPSCARTRARAPDPGWARVRRGRRGAAPKGLQ